MEGWNDVREERNDLFVVHDTEYGPLGNLEAVNMENEENSTGPMLVGVFVRVPCCSSGARLCFSVTDNTGNDKVGIIHDSAKGDTKSVSELIALVNSTRSLSINVTIMRLQ